MDRLFANKTARTLFVFALVLLLGVVAWQAWQLTQFRITKTDPSMSKVATINDSITIFFSKEINPSSFKLVDSFGIVSGNPTFKNKQVVIPIIRLTEGVDYNLTITSVRATNGDEILNKKLAFTAQNLDLSELSDAQQKSLVNKQDKPIYEVATLDYRNFSELTESGITSDQLRNIKQSLFDYSNAVDQKFWTMTVVRGSVDIATYTPGSGNTRNTGTFSVVLNKQTYRANIGFDLISDEVQLTLTSGNGQVVFDSAAI